MLLSVGSFGSSACPTSCPNPTPIEEYLSDTQLHAIIIIVTNLILDEDGSSMVHNGTTYSTVSSPYTGKVWLDRNLGASRACIRFDDEQCYGDYYQWGRNYDGHQDYDSNTTLHHTEDVNSPGNKFIISSSTEEEEYEYYGEFDWVDYGIDNDGSLRSINWSKTDGSSVCPVGFRVPSIEELRAETQDNGVIDRDTAFTNFLKFPSAGLRSGNYDGHMDSVGVKGYVWSSSGGGAYGMRTTIDKADWTSGHRSYGLSVRCIGD